MVIKIPIAWIINKFNALDVNKLFVASTTPEIFFSIFLLCLWDSKKVISSGILVINPNNVPTINSEILKLLHKVFKQLPNKLLIINKINPHKNKIKK